jgi:hypothetical protein
MSSWCTISSETFWTDHVFRARIFGMSELDGWRRGDWQISTESARQENCYQSTMKPALSFSLEKGHRKSIIYTLILLCLKKYKYDGLLYTRNLTHTLWQETVWHKASFLPSVANTATTCFCIIYRGLTTTQLPHKIFLHSVYSIDTLFWINLITKTTMNFSLTINKQVVIYC